MANWDIDDDIGDQEDELLDDGFEGDGWGDDDLPEGDDVVQDWEDAMDPAEVERLKKLEEERKQREKEEIEEAERRRKEEKKQRAREMKQRVLEDSDDDHFFDIDAARENQERLDLDALADGIGIGESTVDKNELDIGAFVPYMVSDFDVYSTKLVEKISSFPMKRVIALKTLLPAFIDDYKGVQMKELAEKFMQLSNKKLMELRAKQHKKAPKKPQDNSKAFMNTRDDEGDDDFF